MTNPPPLTDYAPRLANRLLAGAGLLSLSTEHIPALSHGLTAEGDLRVTCRELDVAHLPDCEIELQISKQALEWDTTMAIAALHGRARIHWTPGAGPTRAGTLRLTELVLHWPAGSTRIGLDRVDPGTRPPDELAVHEAVAAVGRGRLSTLQEMVHLGLCEGMLLSDAARPLCCHQRHRTWIGDADSSGVMVVGTTCDRVITTLAALSDRSDNEVELARYLAAG